MHYIIIDINKYSIFSMILLPKIIPNKNRKPTNRPFLRLVFSIRDPIGAKIDVDLNLRAPPRLKDAL